jgi:hypothetical protein
LDQFVLKNPNQPPPGIQLMSAEELKSKWHSRGYSRLAKDRAARPLIVMEQALAPFQDAFRRYAFPMAEAMAFTLSTFQAGLRRIGTGLLTFFFASGPMGTNLSVMRAFLGTYSSNQ